MLRVTQYDSSWDSPEVMLLDWPSNCLKDLLIRPKVCTGWHLTIRGPKVGIPLYFPDPQISFEDKRKVESYCSSRFVNKKMSRFSLPQKKHMAGWSVYPAGLEGWVAPFHPDLCTRGQNQIKFHVSMLGPFLGFRRIASASTSVLPIAWTGHLDCRCLRCSRNQGKNPWRRKSRAVKDKDLEQLQHGCFQK